jgi:hypothetical protein
MTKVQILIACDHCQGQAYLLDCEVEDYQGRKYVGYEPCPMCEGSGKRTTWVSLSEFARLLEQEKCPHQHKAYQGGFHFSAGDVWDDITEVCIDCGANLDSPALNDLRELISIDSISKVIVYDMTVWHVKAFIRCSSRKSSEKTASS